MILEGAICRMVGLGEGALTVSGGMDCKWQGGSTRHLTDGEVARATSKDEHEDECGKPVGSCTTPPQQLVGGAGTAGGQYEGARLDDTAEALLMSRFTVRVWGMGIVPVPNKFGACNC